MTTSLQPRPARMVDEPGVRFGLANGAIVLALLVAAALPLDVGETAAVALVSAAVAGATLPWAFGVALGAEAWAFFTGFFEHRYGALTLGSHDLLRLAGFVVGTVVLAHLVRVPLARTSGGGER